MPDPAPELYVELLKRAIMGELSANIPLTQVQPQSLPQRLVVEFMGHFGLTVARRDPTDPVALREGRVFPKNADSMIGRARMDNVHQCAVAALTDGVPGDFIEAGVWRGGASILMRGILAAYGDPDRRVWVADSFQGVPPPNPDKHPVDAPSVYHEWDWLAVTVNEVRANFHRYGLLDERVEFVPGWFKDTLPALEGTWSLIRLDGDLYESTIDAICALYPSLSPGGFILVDDYWHIEGCRNAITDYRTEHNITEPIHTVDWTGVYWRRAEPDRGR